MPQTDLYCHWVKISVKLIPSGHERYSTSCGKEFYIMPTLAGVEALVTCQFCGKRITVDREQRKETA